jgi:outer membrane protein assembly factor BamD
VFAALHFDRPHFASRPALRGLALAVLVFLVAPSCASDDSGETVVTYSLTAKQNYDKGLVEMEDENYLEAQKYFRFVKSKFPFSKFAVLAELALADARFRQGEYQSAIDAYKTFARLHPTHEKVDDGYVAYRICECYVEEMPEDWLILPPAAEKDQSAVQDALRELSDFIDKFPESEYLEQARTRRRDVVRRLVEHEVYVARFYLAQGHPKAAILRLEGAIKRYPDSGREADLLLTLGQTHLEMGNPKTAKATFLRVVDEYGQAPQAQRATVFLDFIRSQHGDAPRDARDVPTEGEVRAG